MRRRDHPDVDLARAARAHRADLAGSEEPQQHRLGVRRELADLVQEHGAAVRLAEEPRPTLDGARERTALVAEQLAQEELAREGPAVHRLEPGAAAAAQPVKRGRHQLLARTGLAQDQHGHLVRGHAPDPLEEHLHPRALADQSLEPRQWPHIPPLAAAHARSHAVRRARPSARELRCRRPTPTSRAISLGAGGMPARRSC